MTSNSNNVPLWLDIKTEYIDENFEKVLEYLKSGSKRDAFYQKTIDLLGARIDEYLKTLKTRPACFSESNEYDTNKLSFETRLIGAYLLVVKSEDNIIARKRLYMPFLYSLCLQVPTSLCGDLLSLMVDNVIYEEEPALLFGWDDICDFHPVILAHKILNGKPFKHSQSAQIEYEKKGCVMLWEGALGIAPINLADFKKKKSQMVATLDAVDGKIKTLSQKSAKLKQSEENSIEAIEKHALNFVQEQLKVKPTTAKPQKIYSNGDSLYVEVKTCVWDKVEVKSIDPEYEMVEGRLDFGDTNILYYYKEDFFKYLRVGQIIDVTLESFEKKTFSIKDRFIEYVIEYIVKEDGYIGRVEPAKVAKIYEDKRGEMQMDWLTKSGFPVHTPYDENYQQNDFGMIQVRGASEGKYYGYVYGVVDEGTAMPFDFQASKKEVIEGFDFPDNDNEEAEAKESMMNTAVIRDLLNMMIRYQKTIVNPTERFKLLCVSLVLAAFIESDEHCSYICFIMSYLKQLITFAKGEYGIIEELEPDDCISNMDVVQQRCSVVKILKAYENESMGPVLESIIEQSDDETLIKIAKLIQSCNIIGDVLPAATKNIIKREITKSLSLETKDETNLDEENGIYMGIENLHQEFKTSFVYPPGNDMQPNVKLQERNIFRALCGFLNSEGGGTLYIGVTDLGYVSGIENDMLFLRMTELDTYIRFIQDEAANYFPVDVLKHFIIKPMFDNKVLAIQVEPYMQGIVEFEGKTFIRINNETREMNDKLKNLIRTKKNAKP